MLQVPFVDPLGTLADASLPLTVNEWAEFGNPATPQGFAHLASYSPASNVNTANGGAQYPPMLLRPAAKDARTGWWEAFKFAARVNAANKEVNPINEPTTSATSPTASKTTTATMSPLLVDGFGAVVDMTGGGHFRPAGRNTRAEERSQELAFLVGGLHDAVVAKASLADTS